MKKLKMSRGVTLTFEEGCNKYLGNCRQSYVQFYKFFYRNMLVSKITQKKYNEYILFLRS